MKLPTLFLVAALAIAVLIAPQIYAGVTSWSPADTLSEVNHRSGGWFGLIAMLASPYVAGAAIFVVFLLPMVVGGLLRAYIASRPEVDGNDKYGIKGSMDRGD